MYLRGMTFNGVPIKTLDITMKSYFNKPMGYSYYIDSIAVTEEGSTFGVCGNRTSLEEFTNWLFENFGKVWNLCQWRFTSNSFIGYRFFLFEPREIDIMFRECLEIKEIKNTDGSLINGICNIGICFSDTISMSMLDYYEFVNTNAEPKYFHQPTDVDSTSREVVCLSVKDRKMFDKLMAKAKFMRV